MFACISMCSVCRLFHEHVRRHAVCVCAGSCMPLPPARPHICTCVCSLLVLVHGWAQDTRGENMSLNDQKKEQQKAGQRTGAV